MMTTTENKTSNPLTVEEHVSTAAELKHNRRFFNKLLRRLRDSEIPNGKFRCLEAAVRDIDTLRSNLEEEFIRDYPEHDHADVYGT
jgi:hypothetical protein